jgi:hypothetical protein
MELEGSLRYSQVPTTCPYPEPTPSSPHNPLFHPLYQLYYHHKLAAEVYHLISSNSA